VPVIDWDERLTSQAAERTLLEANISRRRRKQVQVRVAAQLILQSYLEWRARHPAAPLSMPDQISSSRKASSPEDETAEAEHDEMWKPDTDQQR
jgi:Holliday junction resolvase